MPERFERINQIFGEVEAKGVLFVEKLEADGKFEIIAGQLPVLHGEDGRAYFLRKPGGQPIWADVTLIAHDQPRLEIGLNLDFLEYEIEYAELKARQLATTRANQPLDRSDALEALLLAELVKDNSASDTLLFRLSHQFPGIVQALPGLLGRGSSRVRSVFGRLAALLNENEAWSQLLQAFQEEVADGVRADIITTAIIQTHNLGSSLPGVVLEQWLSSESLIDPLSCIMALQGVGLNITPGLFELVKPSFQEQLRPWLD